jgi:hypothetical protein
MHQVLMLNEFNGVTHILFNPSASGGGATIITGVEWLLNWGIDPLTHANLLVTGIAVLAGYTVLFMVLAYFVLSWFQRYVK